MPSSPSPSSWWQAFVDVACDPGNTFYLPLYSDFGEAKQARLDRNYSRSFSLPRTSALRRVSWLCDPGVEAHGRLTWAMEDIVSVAVLGADRSVSWPAGALRVIEAGCILQWHLACFGLAGRAVFTFDFEPVGG